MSGLTRSLRARAHVLATRAAARTAPESQGPATPDALLDDLARLSSEDRTIVERSLPHTMTGVARLQALIDAVRYVERRGIDGGFVECGVWRGGSVLAMIGTLQQLGTTSRHLWLYDTFEGMTEPTDRDLSPYEPPAREIWEQALTRGERPWNDLFDRSHFNEEAVRHLLTGSGYPSDRLHLIRGPVEETLPAQAPKEPLALIRLDTDWYESTRHELAHLYPRLQPGGVLIIDDYGHFEGARAAVDEYFATESPLLLNRIDYTGRLAIKV